MKQIPSDPRKTKQLASNLRLAEGERTEVAINIRTDDGMTNGARNVIKKVKIHNRNSPSNMVQSNSVMTFQILLYPIHFLQQKKQIRNM